MAGYGTTCRQDVLRGVDVPVMPGAAGRALPCPSAEAQFGKQVPARGAGLRAGVPPVDHDQAPPSPARLVLEHGPEGAPPAVRDRLRQPAVADHVLYGEVFEDDHVVVADQAGGGLVEEVGAGGADLAVGAGDFGPGFGAVRGPALTAGQVPGSAFQVTGIGDPLAAAGDRKVGDPEVNADDPARGGELLRVGYVNGERDVPASAGITGDCHRRRVDRGGVDAGPGPGECQRRIHLGQVQAAVAPPEPGPGVLRGLPTVPRLEPRIPGPLGEERGVGGLLVPDRLLQRDAGHLVQPGQFLGGFHGGQVGVRLGEGHPGLLRLVPLAAPGQGPVPYDADAAERAVQHAGLLRVGVGPAFVRRSHNGKSYSIISRYACVTR